MRVLAVVAHPDDETLFLGGVLAGLAASGAEVSVLSATLGEGALWRPEDGEKGWVRAAEQRSDQWREACALLGARRTIPLGGAGRWRDYGHVPGPYSPARADRAELAGAIRTVAAALDPDIVLTTGDQGITRHPDHIAVHAAVAACKFPIVLAACLPIRQVLFAELTLAEAGLAPEPVGLAGGGGFPFAVPLPDAATAAKQAACDVYYPGLGTAPLRDLTTTGYGRDVLALRAIWDETDWTVEWFENHGTRRGTRLLARWTTAAEIAHAD
ncbi:PIG-L deacetylase family protein [Actinocatenispora rupis]|uniref:N-acetylglucosaminyl deacetylase, LmbE family n=1 Tax=Actinocatenispora rupis TaxID=519421 RepID=A0A8J3J3P5_9ACTN|nr:PIG-L deacetylase family protein [Actinocatenispora rupis]GID11041.1 hypothetical protein Aru02nite_19300 [Actinocatenispora rupis]